MASGPRHADAGASDPVAGRAEPAPEVGSAPVGRGGSADPGADGGPARAGERGFPVRPRERDRKSVV